MTYGTLGIVAGLSLALAAEKQYDSTIVLAPSEYSELTATADKSLGGLGALGGLNLGLGSELDTSIALEVLSSPSFIQEFIKNQNILPLLFGEPNGFKVMLRAVLGSSNEPTLWDGYELFVEDVLNIRQDRTTGLLYVTITTNSAERSALWARLLIQEVNEVMRDAEMERLAARYDYLENKLSTVKQQSILEAVVHVIEQQISRNMMAAADRDFAFKLVSPPVVRPLDKYTWPNYWLAAFLGAAFGIFLSLGLVLRETVSPQQPAEAR